MFEEKKNKAHGIWVSKKEIKNEVRYIKPAEADFNIKCGFLYSIAQRHNSARLKSYGRVNAVVIVWQYKAELHTERLSERNREVQE